MYDLLQDFVMRLYYPIQNNLDIKLNETTKQIWMLRFAKAQELTPTK
jgi:hypothetical protein